MNGGISAVQYVSELFVRGFAFLLLYYLILVLFKHTMNKLHFKTILLGMLNENYVLLCC